MPSMNATWRSSSDLSLDFLARDLDRSPKKRGQFLYLTSLEMSSSKCSVHQPITTVRLREHFGAYQVFSMSLAWIVEHLSLERQHYVAAIRVRLMKAASHMPIQLT